MRFRSTTRVENVIEMYAPLTPAYATKTTRAATLVVTKARVFGSRGSPRGRASAATPAISGSTPIPIASAPSAQDACSRIRSRKKPVVSRQLLERCPTSAEKPTAAPTASVTSPTQSQRDQVVRHSRIRSDCQPSHASESRRTANRIESCVRVSIAAAHASAARPSRLQLGSTSTRAISQSARVASGYASGSSTRKGEYASAGTITAPAAAASAYQGGTTSRASA